MPKRHPRLRAMPETAVIVYEERLTDDILDRPSQRPCILYRIVSIDAPPQLAAEGVMPMAA